MARSRDLIGVCCLPEVAGAAEHLKVRFNGQPTSRMRVDVVEMKVGRCAAMPTTMSVAFEDERTQRWRDPSGPLASVEDLSGECLGGAGHPAAVDLADRAGDSNARNDARDESTVHPNVGEHADDEHSHDDSRPARRPARKRMRIARLAYRPLLQSRQRAPCGSVVRQPLPPGLLLMPCSTPPSESLPFGALAFSCVRSGCRGSLRGRSLGDRACAGDGGALRIGEP